MTPAYQSTLTGGVTRPISALRSRCRRLPPRGRRRKIAAGGVPTIIGGIAGGGKGAAIGAGAGAGAGTILMLATEGDEVVLAAGQQLSVQMTAPTEIAVAVQR
jgi:hypothetical protein